jgi:hypothetical protein
MEQVETSLLISCLAYSSTLMNEATCSSETSVDFQRTARRYIPEDGTFHTHRCENLKSYTFKFVFNTTHQNMIFVVKYGILHEMMNNRG